MSLVVVLLRTLLLTALSTALAQTSEKESLFPLSSYSMRSPYLEESLSNPRWDFGGDAMMEVNRYIRLTTDAQSQSGWLWTKTPLFLTSWLVEFQFKVSYEGGISGDGFAFWVTKGHAEEGPVFGSKDKFEGLGVFFDTYANSKVKHVFPYVMAMVGDGKKEYGHDFDGNNEEIGGCHAEFRNRDFITRARVKYVENDYLQVELDIIGNGQWTTCLKVDKVKLPSSCYIGFTAMTGAVSSAHDIIEISTFRVTTAADSKNATDSKEERKPAPEPKAKDGSGSSSYNTGSSGSKKSSPVQESSEWSAVVIILVAVVGVVVGYGGWVMYKTSKANSYKRF
ncbi:hypothetical protein BASA50_003078 [Batrachochytrium salamandrivorans]|uniref:L-type lectin-like domain-containing protein n=1 Tax=Batrachochytrium salamandrivorans TaxID=1357716 RepID=A0ABQ8FJK4_9FUNG|nr:hypothetical protein BASA62_005269 [Batrachochytrium salamandrivorans]KAH6582127.1 hypothetical protein BASA60_002094 [Batrachochytrium salamandrivorans]KAH6599381.1 hypothetical protein BASA50_003078 [Batrachochytrium salamandrivorans]KAH6602620.1 hypothetical protein BASA61_000953 [Batrachochytrium salamandrivorans]KAJ1328593.1 hypothetical protein BSLG_010325 [Batrachochytrium salamandrivorans]